MSHARSHHRQLADKAVGDVPSGSKPRIIRDSHELETVSIGEVIAPLNDYCLLWDEVCEAIDDHDNTDR